MRKLLLQELFTFEEAGVLLGVCARSISRAVAAGELRAIQGPGTRGLRGRRISREEINRYIEAAYREQQDTRDLEQWRAARRERGPKPLASRDTA